MNGAKWPSQERVIDEIHSRLLFQNRLATGLIIAVIVWWYLFEIVVVLFAWDAELFQWLFTTKSFPAISPGLFFATISHQLPPQMTHIVSNVVGLWLFAGESEQHMSTLEVVGFFVTTALVSVLVGTAISVDSTMGASGGVFAFIGFYCIHMVLEHQNELELDTLGSTDSAASPLQTYGIGLLITPIVMIPYLLAQLTGFVPAGQSDVVGHFTGLLCGMGYALICSVTR